MSDGNRKRALSLAHADYMAFKSLTEARQHPNGYVVMTDHCGGLTLLTIPAAQVHCTHETIVQLLFDLSIVTSSMNLKSFYPLVEANVEMLTNGEGHLDLLYKEYDLEAHPPSYFGPVGKTLWLHEDIEQAGMRPEVEAVLVGQKPRMTWPLPVAE